MVKEIQSFGELQALLGDHKKATVVDFFATWCGPCRAIAPEFERVSSYHPRCHFCKVDVDRVRDAAAAYQVTAMPTFIVFANGSIVEKVVGGDIRRLEQAIDRAVSSLPRETAPTPAIFPGSGVALGGAPLHPVTRALCEIQQATVKNDLIGKKDACDALYKLLFGDSEQNNNSTKPVPIGVVLLPYLASKAFQAGPIDELLTYMELLPSPDSENAKFLVYSLINVFVGLLGNATWESESKGTVHNALANFVRCDKVRGYIAGSAQLVPPPFVTNGEQFEQFSLFGALFAVGPGVSSRGVQSPIVGMAEQRRVQYVMQTFSMDPAKPTQLERSTAERVVQSTQSNVQFFQTLNFPIVRELLRDATRVPTLQALARMLETNQDFTKTMRHNSRLTSPSAMVMLQNTLVELALPVVSGTAFDPSSIPVHYTYDPSSLVPWGKEVERIRHFSEENPLPAVPGQTAYPPKVHLFFLALRAVSLGAAQMLLHYDENVRRGQHPRQRAQERHYLLADSEMTRALLSSPTTATNLLRFLNGAAKWLLHVMGVDRATGKLPPQPSEAWSTLPQEIIENIIRGTRLVTAFRVSVSAGDIHDIMSLMLVLMGNNVYFPKSHAHALFPPLLIALLNQRDTNEALQNHPWFQTHIVTSCMRCYIAMEKSEYEKVQTRYELGHCLKVFLQQRSLCDPVREELNLSSNHLLEQFSHMVTADVNSSVDHVVDMLTKMHAKVASGADLEAADRDRDNEDENKELSYSQLGSQLKSNIMLFEVMIEVFIGLVQQFADGVAQNMVAQQISQMLARSLTTFAGPRCRELTIRYGERYNFHPKTILTKLVECLVGFRRQEHFLRCLVECGVALPDLYEAMGHIVHRKLVRETLTEELTRLYNDLLAKAKSVEEEISLWDDAPEYALDALMSDPLTDPVALPSDVKDLRDLVFANRSTIHHMLLREPKHPYTKAYLDEAMVTAFNERADVVATVADLKKRIAAWLEEAKKAAKK